MTSEYATRQAGPPGPRPQRPDPQGLLLGLEQLRSSLRQRLDSIEALALERPEFAPADPTEREQVLRRRVAELEERLARLSVEAKRREQEHQAAMEQLEADRRLIAEAWERLELERTGFLAPAAPAARQAAPAAAPPAPVLRPTVDAAGNDAVANSILKQFQALRSDVRKNGSGRHAQR
jgi:hypothetical protein